MNAAHLICSECGQSKPLEAFRDRRFRQCRFCDARIVAMGKNILAQRLARTTHPRISRTELDVFAFCEARDLSVMRARATGFSWRVDHIVPIKYRLASGLHVSCNFQVVPRSWNDQKKNLTTQAYWPMRETGVIRLPSQL